MKIILTGILLLAFTMVVKAQVSGNMVYENNRNQPVKAEHQEIKKLFLSDSTFIIDARVLINRIADSYVVTFGISDSSATVRESNEKINKRIDGFIASLAKFNISPQDVYVDMTTQTEIYDYNIENNTAIQYLKGFEVKKNIIFKLKNIRNMDNLMITASNFKIYDLVKLDYVVEDLSNINMQLFKLATGVINQKKELYVLATNATLIPTSQIYGEDYFSYYPSQLYKTYTARSSGSNIQSYSTRISIVKNLKDPTTFYYDAIDYSGFDMVINPSVTEPVIEFALNFQIKFQLDKGRK